MGTVRNSLKNLVTSPSLAEDRVGTLGNFLSLQWSFCLFQIVSKEYQSP